MAGATKKREKKTRGREEENHQNLPWSC